MPKGILLDTSFFLRFLKEDDPLFKNADDYFRYFLTGEFSLTDLESIKAYNVLREDHKPGFSIIDLNTTYSETFGILEL